MSVQLEKVENFYEILLGGDVYGKDPELDKCVLELFEAMDIKINPVLINFKNTRNIDSGGIGFLIRIVKKCQEKSIRLAFSEFTPTMSKIMHIVGFNNYVKVFMDDKSARQYLLTGVEPE